MGRYVVTGGCGFIGSHLAEQLLKRKAHVIIIDNLSSGTLDNIKEFAKDPLLTFINTDIAKDQLDSYFQTVDGVFHLAALTDIVPSITNPQAYFHANVLGTFNVIQAAQKNQVKKLIYAASSSCYGIPKQFPTPESQQNNPMYPYALTKMIGEQTALHWNQVYQFPVISLRLFNVYGPRSRTNGTYGAMFGVFLAQILAGKPLTIVGDGEQSRDFTYVSDVVNAFITAMESKAENTILNVGSGKPTSVNTITKLLLAQKNIVYVPKRPGEPDCTWADITKIQHILNWAPTVTIEEGIAILLNNIHYWEKAPVWTQETIAVATAEWFKHLGGKDYA